jgi:hypothetical protein
MQAAHQYNANQCFRECRFFVYFYGEVSEPLGNGFVQAVRVDVDYISYGPHGRPAHNIACPVSS